MWENGLDAKTLAYAAAQADKYRDNVVPELTRHHVRETCSLRQFHHDYVRPERERQLQANEVAKGTVAKELEVISRYERFSRPAQWEPDAPWFGFPLGLITGPFLRETLANIAAALCVATAASTWFHLRTILRRAVKLRVLDAVPDPAMKFETSAAVCTYKATQLETAFRALAPEPDLQVSFVLSVNAGMRVSDLFSLRVADLDLDCEFPSVAFTARKTGKHQRVPLAPVTVAQLRRLDLRGTYLFPGRSSPEALDPERCRPARHRRERWNELFESAGLDFPKPLQVARATCNTRLNTVRPGAGEFVLGHGLSLNSKSYMDPSDLIREAVLAVPQPSCFFEGTPLSPF